MNRIVCSSVRLFGVARASSRTLFARSFGSSTLSTSTLSPRPHLLASSVTCRHYAKKTINTEPVVSEKQKRQEFLRLIEEEVSVLKSTMDDSDNQNAMRWEVADRFLKETNFKLEEDKEAGMVKLTRTHGDKTVIVVFPGKPEDQTYYPQEEQDQEYDEEGEEERENEEEEREDEDEEGGGDLKREQPFTVEVRSNRPGKEDQKIVLSCFSSSDGSFVVSELNSGDGKRIPVHIGDWSEDLQRELISWLEPLGINERLSYFIHQYLDRNQQEDNIKILQEFRQFVSQ